MEMKWIGQKKRYRAYKARIGALPASYRAAAEALERYYYYCGGGTAEGGLQMMEDLVELFETAAASQTPLRDIVGSDPVEFATEFLANYPDGNWIVRERDRLNRAIQAAEDASAG